MPGVYDASIQAGSRVIKFLDTRLIPHVQAVQEAMAAAFPEFVQGLPPGRGLVAPVSGDAAQKYAVYTDSVAYFKRLRTTWHDTINTAFLTAVLSAFEQPETQWHTVVDAGCMYGLAGMAFAARGHQVFFHDYPGLGLDFCAWYAQRQGYQNVACVPYGAPLRRADMCLALDVLEHTGNHLQTLRWLKELGHVVAMTYPTSIAFAPPYEPTRDLDEWVDDEALSWVLQARYDILFTSLQYNRRMVLFQ